MSKLSMIYDFLNKCGIDAEIRTDRKENYVNVGNVKRVRERMQFWIPDDSVGVDMYVGVEMGVWYKESLKSPYLNSNWSFTDKENKISFPDMVSMKEFIEKVSKL